MLTCALEMFANRGYYLGGRYHMRSDQLANLCLRDGTILEVQRVRPPVEEALAEEVHGFINGCLTEPYHRAVLTGRLDARASVRYFLGRVGGQLAGTCWYAASPANRTVGCLAGVVTAENQRRKGMARALCSLALDDFHRRGGVAMYLAYASDSARALYRSMGFVARDGCVMRHVLPGADFDREYFAPAMRRWVTCATWNDLARTVPLYLHPHEWHLLDAKAGVYSNRHVPSTRCVGVFVTIWECVARCGGTWLLLGAEDGRIVGAGVLYPETADMALVDFVLHPNHYDAAETLLGALAEEARRRSLRRIECRFVPEDREKIALAVSAGLTARDDSATGFLVAGRHIS